jgi:3-oxoacyl-[acyl-carrier protein] reductase
MTAGLPREARERALAETPLGRAARPEDIAAAVRFFLSRDAAHVTGQALAVDGGQAMGA